MKNKVVVSLLKRIEIRQIACNSLSRIRQQRIGLKSIYGVFFLILTVGCTQIDSFESSHISGLKSGEVRKILLMPVDVELYEVGISGIPKPKPTWTQQATHNLEATLDEAFEKRKIQMEFYGVGANPAYVYSPDHLQLVKLHEAVGRSILLHKNTRAFELPTKTDRFDWTLGYGVRILQKITDADYALFLLARDSKINDSRAGMMLATILLGGHGQRGRAQTILLSLVDLNSGDIVWFNLLVNPVEDLRNKKWVRVAVDKLLQGAPL